MLVTEIAILCIGFFANAIGTISGVGVSTLLTPTLLFFFPLKETILLVCIIHLFHDAAKTIFFYRFIDIPLTISFGGSAALSSIFASFVLIKWHNPNLSGLLGIFLLIYAAILFFNPAIRLSRDWKTISISGIITGFIAGLFGILGAFKSMFLVSFDVGKKTFVGTSGLVSFIINITRLVSYLLGGIILNQEALFLLPWLIIVSFLGTVMGRYLVHIIPAHIFNRVVLVFITAVAIKLVASLF